MRKLLVAAGLILAALAMVACFDETNITGPSQTQGQGQTNGPGPSPSPQLPGVCPPVVGLNAHALDGGTVPAGTVVTLDATPQFQFELSPEEHVRCSQLAGILWSQPLAPCSLSNEADFNPLLTRATAGACTTTATVTGHSASVTVTFQ